MGIDVVRIGIYVWKFLKLSFNTSYGFFRKDPYVGVILILVFLLYMFLPFYFIILVVCSPLIALFAVGLRVYLKYKRAKLQNVNEIDKKKSKVHSGRSVSLKDDDAIILRSHSTTISRQMSRRTNFKDKNKLDLDRQASSEKKDDIVALTANTMELLGLTSQNEDKPKVILDVNGEGCTSKEVIISDSWSRPDFTSHSGSDKRSRKYDGIHGEVESVEEAEEDDDDDGDDEEEAQEYRSRGVEWTKDDQKNLMDLGISEIERNKRLETLIAKRRAKTEGDKDLTDTEKDNNFSSEMEIAPIAVSRTNSSNTPRRGLPCSAPPVLLPSRNPFDIPYDPLEEKPNLLGDNFHEEFRATQPKNLVFSRHESFTLGTSCSVKPKKDQKESMFGPYFSTICRESEVSGNPNCQRQPKKGDHDQLVEKPFLVEGESISQHLKKHNLVQEDRAPNDEINSTELQHEKDEETDNSTTESQGKVIENAQNSDSELAKQSQVQIETDATEVNHSKSSASSSSKEDDIVNANIDGVSVSITSRDCNILDLLQPSAEDKTRRDDHLLDTNRKSSHPNHSVASDKQVEVSKIGSPPPIEAGFLGTNLSSVDPSSSSIQHEIPEYGQSNLIDSDHKIQDKKKQVTEDIGDSGTSKLSLECLEAEQLIETLRVHPSLQLMHKDDIENLESNDDRDDETISEYSVDISEKQSEYEGASDIRETFEERSKLNLFIEEEAQQNTIELGSSGTDQSSNDHNKSSLTPQHKRHTDLLLDDVEDMEKSGSPNAKPAMNDIIPRSLNTSDQKNSQESGNLSFTEDNSNLGKLNELDDKAEDDRNLELIEDAEGDLVDTMESEAADNPPISAEEEQNDLLLKSSTAASNMLQIVNETLMSEIMNKEKDKSFEPGEVESQISTMEEPVPELVTAVDESELKSIRGNEPEGNYSSNAIQNFKSEPESLAENSSVADSQVNHELIAEVPETVGTKVTISKSEVNDGNEGQSEVESQASATKGHNPEPSTTAEEHNSRTIKDTEGENKRSSEDSQSDESEGIDK